MAYPEQDPNDMSLTCHSCPGSTFRGRRALEDHLSSHGKIQVPKR